MIFLAAVAACLLLVVRAHGAGSLLLMDSFGSEPSQALNTPYRTATHSFNYTGGTVTFTSCSNQNCTWAIDDAARLVVTRPDGTQVTRDFISDTKDKPAENVTSLFQVGNNTVTIQMIDRVAPLRGLPRPLYLVESSTPLPAPSPSVKSLPTSKTFNSHPYAANSLDPVNTYTGSFLYEHTDLSIKGRGPFPHFARSYDSSDSFAGPMGPGWTHSYAMQLVRPDETTNDIVLIGSQGRADRFTHNNGTYTAPAGIYTTLAKNSDNTYTVTHKDQSTWSFDDTGKLARISDRFGNSAMLSYDADGKLISVSDPAARGTLTFGYDGANRLTSVTDWANRVVRYGYDVTGRLSTVTDRENQVTTFGYDGTSHRLTTIRDARNNTAVTNTYDAQGRVATQKDARGLTTGQQTTFAYNTNADGTKTTVITYPKTSADPAWSFVEEDTYNAQGRITKKVSKPVANSADWITQEYGYDSNGNRSSHKDGRGNTTQYCYDVDYAGAAIAGSRGNLTRVIAPAPTTGANMPVTLYAYDNKGNLTQTVAPKGVASTLSVNCTTNLASSVNTNYATDHTYDATTQTKLLSSTERFTEPGVGLKTATTKYEYGDPANPGLPTKVVSPRGNTAGTPDYSYATTNTYYTAGTKAGLLESATTPAGATTTYDYDAAGRRIAMVDPKGNVSGATAAHFTWQYSYDNEDRLRFTRAPAPVAGQAQLVTENRYDVVGNKTSVIDANGQVTRYTYDDRDSLQEVHQTPDTWTDPAATPSNLIVTGYQYDNMNNLSRITRAKGNSTQERVTDYAYDGLNRQVRETQYPNWPATTPTLVTTQTYDKNSNQASLKDPLNKTTTYTYDSLNRQTNITYNSTTTPNVTYAYDINNNRTSMVDGTGTTTYTYDERNRMLSVQSPGPKTIGYRYDLEGNRNKLIYPDNTAVNYTFDKANRLASLTDWSNRTTSYEYNIDSTPKKVNHQMNGTSANYTYDNASRMTQVSNKLNDSAVITQHSYQLDAVGNRTRADEVLTDAIGYDDVPVDPDRIGSVTYTYDRLYRVASEHRQLPSPNDGDNTFSYTYDTAGNILSETESYSSVNLRTDYTYDRADRIKTASGDRDEVYTVDANGNMTRRGPQIIPYYHTYDQANRMIRSGNDKFRYFYDGDGKRTKIQELVNRVWRDRSTYLYDVNQEQPQLLQDSKNKYVMGLDLLYAVNSSNEPSVYHLDGLGSMRAMTNASDPSFPPDVDSYQSYRAFGTLDYSNRNFNDQPFKFTGEQQDDITFSNANYVYLRSRHYDPAIGRFTTRDTYAGDLMQPQSLNRYSYVENNPVNVTDPSGHCGPCVLLIPAATAAGFAYVGLSAGAQEVGGGINEDIETTPEWLARFGGSLAEEAAKGAAIKRAARFLVHPGNLGSKPNFPNPAWWYGVRARIAYTEIGFDLIGYANDALTAYLNSSSNTGWQSYDPSAPNYFPLHSSGGRKPAVLR